MLYILQTALQLGCIYSLVSLALLLSYRILDIADLTTDGCFVLGMAVSVSFCAMGHPFAGLILAVLAGGCAGLVTAFLQTHMGIPSIIAGIITNTGLYTVNLAVMGFSSSISLLKSETVFTKFRALGIGGSWYSIILAAFASLLCMAVLRWFLETRLGLSIRATGDNPDMVSASSIDPRRMIMIGLFLSNCMTALAGGIAGQLQKSADINAGTGIVVVGLACLIIGETAVGGRKSLSRNIIACLAGNIIYRMIYAVILQTRILPIECLKLMTAVIVALAISAPYLQAQRQLKQKARRRASNA
ncbi:MAG: ABC transporter permease [Solobacterium sp.]|nr:ABC transporter permease [Erysipelotrichaceae bacterium]MBQ9154003.1 ABC transporter permease [Solobacterium sp.]